MQLGSEEGCEGYQTFLKPAVMLLLGVAEPGSSTEVVIFNGPATVCSMLSLLCHWLSVFEALAPAEKVVPHEPTFNFNVSSRVRAWVGWVIVPITDGGALVTSGSAAGVY